jgi:hypothetical protein
MPLLRLVPGPVPPSGEVGAEHSASELHYLFLHLFFALVGDMACHRRDILDVLPVGPLSRDPLELSPLLAEEKAAFLSGGCWYPEVAA